jgi:hypothetical protein
MAISTIDNAGIRSGSFSYMRFSEILFHHIGEAYMLDTPPPSPQIPPNLIATPSGFIYNRSPSRGGGVCFSACMQQRLA